MSDISDAYARVTREQYNDWLSRFYPRQQQLMHLATDNTLLDDQLGRVDQNSAHALSSAWQATQARNERMGITPPTTTDNTQGLRMALMTAGSENALREQARQRQLSILTGASGGLRDSLSLGGR